MICASLYEVTLVAVERMGGEVGGVGRLFPFLFPFLCLLYSALLGKCNLQINSESYDLRLKA